MQPLTVNERTGKVVQLVFKLFPTMCIFKYCICVIKLYLQSVKNVDSLVCASVFTVFIGPTGTILFHPGCTLITFMPRLSPPGSKSWSTFTSQHGNYRLSLLALSYLLCYPIISPYVSLSLFMFDWQKHIFSLKMFSPSSWMSGKDKLQIYLFIHLQYVHTLF